MDSKITDIAEKIRDRFCERALAGAPQWLAPMLPAARNTAGSLLIGHLIGRLPHEDESAMIAAILQEQNDDGSWPRVPDGAGDLSVTLEVVQALSASGDESVRMALARAVHWLEENRRRELDLETLLLIGSLSDMPPTRLYRWQMSAVRWISPRRNRILFRKTANPALRTALAALALDSARANRFQKRLLERQRNDGSWDGAARTTMLALAALRHASLPTTDTAFERGWRFLRGLQLWNHGGLIQNPCDLSSLLHAVAVRSLLTAGAEPDAVMASVLTLLHHGDEHGLWAAGAGLPADFVTTAWALDALSLAGDSPVETAWMRRRAVLALLRAQRRDGSWPLVVDAPQRLAGALWERGSTTHATGSVEATAAVVQALAYCGLPPFGQQGAVEAGVRFLLCRQGTGGVWKGSAVGDIPATSLALEALTAAGTISAEAVFHGVRALEAEQRADGGWKDDGDSASSPLHTAFALRALCGTPISAESARHRAREFLLQSVDMSELLWTDGSLSLLPPFAGESLIVPELTSLWALEALTPIGLPERRKQREHRTKSLFNRSM